MIYDRFGNTYSIAEIEETPFFQSPINCEGAGDFILNLDDAGGVFNEDERNVICDVFTYLSSIIDAPSNEQAIIRFTKDPSLPAFVAATASPLFPNQCGLGHSLVHRQLTTGGQRQSQHGFIEINPDVNFYYLDNDGSTNIEDGQSDFYTVILHEALHVLGFGSQISTSGDPLQDFYTQWDLGLRAQNSEPLILRSPGVNGACCATYEFNESTDLILPDDILNQVCGATITYDVSSSVPIYGEYPGNSDAVFLNTLSHLNNSCTPETRHVMNYTILPGEAGVQRTLSTDEIEIMCSLGFSLSMNECSDTPVCNLIAANDGIFFVGQGESIEIPFTELLANDVTNDPNIELIEGCGSNFGLSIEQLGEGFKIDGNFLGGFIFCYLVTDCNGESCDIGYVKVQVTNPLIFNGCEEANECQINPYPTFNIFENLEQMLFSLSDDNFFSLRPGLSASLILFDDYGGNQTPDFYPANQSTLLVPPTTCNSVTNVFINPNIDLVGTIATFFEDKTYREGIVIPLCETVYPGMTISIELFAITPTSNCIDDQLGIQFDFSENPPVSSEIIYENPGTAMPPIIDQVNKSFSDVNLNQLTVDDKQSITIQNTSNKCLNYLYISPFMDKDNLDFTEGYGYSFLMGDIQVNINNSLLDILNLSATPSDTNIPIGEIVEIEISLENIAACAGNNVGYPASTLNLELPAGLVHIPNGDFPEANIFIDENELNPDANYTLTVRIDDPSLIGQPLTINATMITNAPCYDDGVVPLEIATVTLCQAEGADFFVQSIEGECGVYDFISSSSTEESIHRWYLNEQIENAIFSMEVNPTNHMLLDGDHTIIHVVEGSCGTEVFEVPLPTVDCNNSLFTCPCEGPDAINIEAGIGTPLSQLIASGEMPVNKIENTCLAINGHLLIDQAAMGAGSIYEFLESEVRMQPGSSITVEAEAALSINGNENGGIHGCFDLWKGISLAPGSGAGSSGISGGQLSLEDALIEDAVYAVKLSHKSTFEMVQTTLNRNHIGIYMPPSSGLQSVSQPTPPQKSIIKSTGALLDSYSGQEVQTGTTSYAGVEINDSKFQIGGGFSGVEISDANYGVIARRAAINIFSSLIYNMVEAPLDFRSNTAIRAVENSWVGLRNSRLHNLKTGISGINSSLYALNNIIGEVPEGDIRGDVQNGISLNTNIGNVVDISDQNKFNVTGSGVHISRAQRANSILIKDNTVELNPLPGETGTGIWLTGALMSGDNEDRLVISNNIINLHEFGYGIGLDNVNGVTIAGNNINYSPFIDRSISARGIFLALSSDNYAYDNTVSGNGLSNNQRGIEVIGGDRNALCCNYVENTNIGVSFIGYCEDTKLRHTTLTNNSLGLQCFNNTRIGLQLAAGNTWDVSSSVQAKHLSVAADVAQSLFFVAGSAGTASRPNYETPFVVDQEWFVPGLIATSCEVDTDNCERPELNLLATDVVFTQKILQGDFLYGSYPETSDWEAKRVFYRSQRATKLEEQSNWSNESRVFFAQQFQHKSALNTLTIIDQTLEEAMRVDPLVTEATSKMHLLNDQLFSLDQTLEEGEEPSDEYLAERSVLLELKAGAFVDFSALLQQRETDHLALVAQLKQDNTNISTPIEAAMAMQAVNSWYLETMAEGLEDLPLITESALREMAERCPQRFGSAVGRAQSILIHYDKSFISSEECKEGEKPGFKVSNGSDAEKIGSHNEVFPIADIHIYPNPASGVFTIQLPQNGAATSWKIEMFDLRGQLLKSKTSQGREVKLNSAKFSAGVYLIRVQSKGRSISKRVIIQ
jgi:hypothetical protein